VSEGSNKFHSRSVISIGLCAALLFGCAMPLPPGASPAQQRLAQQNSNFNSTVAEGAVGGALVGALGGLLIGGSLKDVAIGAGAGAVAGGVAGYLVAQNNFAHAQTEETLKAAIADARTSTAKAQQMAADARQVASEAQQKAASLAQQVRARQITADQYRTQLASYRQSAEQLEAISKKLGEQSVQLRDNARRPMATADFSTDANAIDASRREMDMAAAQIRRALEATPAA